HREGENLVVRRLDGAGGDVVIAQAPNPLAVTSATPDGHEVVYSDYGQRNGHIHLAATDATRDPTEVPVEGDGYEIAGMLSPDGRWLGYVSTKSRREEVCMRRWNGSGGSWQLSNNQGGGIRWGREGRELFFVTGERLVRVSIAASGDD